MARWTLGTRAAALCAALLALACSGKPGGPGVRTSSATVSVVGVSPDQVEKVTLVVSGVWLVSPIVQDLSRSATGWAGTVSSIPAGGGYSFVVEAFGPGSPGPLLFVGSADPVTVDAEQTALVAITLLEVNPTPGPTSKVPVVVGLGASTGEARPGAVVHVGVTAYSPEGHALAYHWQSACGTFADPTVAATDWTAGISYGPSCSLSVRVSDATNTTAVTAYLVVVIAVRTSVDVEARLDAFPVVTVAAEEHLVRSPDDAPGWAVGITADLVATASDPDGEAVTYSWTSDCGGSFKPSADAAEVRFYVGDPEAVCTLTLEVGDPRGAVTTASVEFSAPPTRRFVAVDAASNTVALEADGTLWGWGANSCGQLGGYGSTLDQPAPWKLGSGFASVAAGGASTFALKKDGTVWAWGGSCAVGQGTTSPVQIGSDFASISAGGSHAAGIKTDGTLWAWGSNGGGQIGDGTTTPRVSPVLIGSGFAVVAAGGAHTVAVKTDGTLWAWGWNYFGAVGDGTQDDRYAPVQIGAGFVSVSAGEAFNVGLRGDGTLWAWGDNRFGQIGDGTVSQAQLVPEQIGSGFASVAAGTFHTLAITTDGTLWGWGNNTYGGLGDGNALVIQPTPVRIGSGFTTAAGGVLHSVAIKTDGTVWTWGRNEYGQLGDDTKQDRYTPGLVIFPR